MAKPFDATTKRLLEFDPAGWLDCVGLPVTGPVRAVDSNLSSDPQSRCTVVIFERQASACRRIEKTAG